MTAHFDLIVIGGGIMGCASAIRAAQHGMRVAMIERASIGGGASGVNAGTLSLQIKRVKLMPYALAGHRIWEEAGEQVGFAKTGGLTLAFTDVEAEQLRERMTAKREAGAPIHFLSQAEVREKAPNLCERVKLASWCAEDGYANSSLTGTYYRAALREAGVTIIEGADAPLLARAKGGFQARIADEEVHGTRILLACGAGLEPAMAMFGVHIPVRVRVNSVSVTERAPRLVDPVIGHVTGLLTLKQKGNGTVLIGGGWQGRIDERTGASEVDPETIIPNLQLAQFVLPALARLRVVRCWTGFEVNVADFYPLAGPLPGVEGAYVLGCVRGGYTIGPYIGRLMGDLIAGREPEMPLFDPARLLAAAVQ
ncbi:NAD(P)/FAD-dependent oxidoreductase [Sphingobium subterraneum]|uniref:Glycine/D-amino acid oxidase-like deaminating enzyme n=1 Tax=Sphingobium subterraneum TaxID=627688 RepID=A0A841J496_9SPHN|nr:FAD-binding oxidoreductase [Sphingobium subterraneum]MBB6123405.1 glycine/D-amino acid oxidase-like deaminating enzyme [Sphingobium subterraneum]